MKKLTLFLLLLTSSCGGVDIANDSSSLSEDNSVDIDNSQNGIYSCSYSCEPSEDSEGYTESFTYEGGPDDCAKLVADIDESCVIVEDVEEPVIGEIVVPAEESPEPDDGFEF